MQRSMKGYVAQWACPWSATISVTCVRQQRCFTAGLGEARTMRSHLFLSRVTR